MSEPDEINERVTRLEGEVALSRQDAAAARVLAERDAAILPTLATGGDDYELLFAAPLELDEEIASLSESLGLPITQIGAIEAGEGVRLIDTAGKDVPIGVAGWRHF